VAGDKDFTEIRGQCRRIRARRPVGEVGAGRADGQPGHWQNWNGNGGLSKWCRSTSKRHGRTRRIHVRPWPKLLVMRMASDRAARGATPVLGAGGGMTSCGAGQLGDAKADKERGCVPLTFSIEQDGDPNDDHEDDPHSR